jgi:trehalose 6-phosphate synthase/phosphatase
MNATRPVFHNVDLMDQLSAVWNTEGAYSSLAENYLAWIKAYRDSTKVFEDTIAPIVSKGDIVWVHDYHMMLLPKALRSRNLGVNVVYFVHIPFPTSQIFRSMPDALELLESMTCADVVGFHSFDYTRHFLNACKRMLGLKSKTIPGGLLVVTVGLRELIVTMSHVSVEPDLLDKALADEETKKMADAIRQKHAGKKIIVSVDVAQRLSGSSLRYLAYETLLTDNQNLIQVSAEESRPPTRTLIKRNSLAPGTKVVLIERAICNNARPDDQKATLTEAKDFIRHINEKFDGAVDYQEVKSMSMKEHLALWLAADVFLSTSIREGLNLMPMEYIYAHKDMENAGVVVSSEFSMCSALLNGGLKVNPFNIQMVADQIDKALHMSTEEKISRRQRDIEFVSTHPSAKWTFQILTEIALFHSSMSKKPTIRKVMPSLIDHNLLTTYYNASELVGISDQCRRLFIFDYGGTLLYSEKQDIYIKQSLSAISGRKPSPRLMEALKVLCNDPNNVVMVVTGLTKMKLGDTFKDFPNLTIVTSNGLVYSWGESMKGDDLLGDDDEKRGSDGSIMEGIGTDANGRLWGCLDFNIDWNAVRKIAVPIISQFTFRTNGTCQTPRIPGIGWSYFGADPDWGIKQMTQLTVELEAALAHFDIKIASQIQGSIEIVPSALDKGIFVRKFLRRALEKRGGKYPPFVMIVGDEASDDLMHKALYKEIATASPAAAVHEMKAFTINVGKRETPADLYAYNVQDVENMIVNLATATQNGNGASEEIDMVMHNQILHVETGP